MNTDKHGLGDFNRGKREKDAKMEREVLTADNADGHGWEWRRERHSLPISCGIGIQAALPLG